MSFIKKSIIAGAAFFALHAYRKNKEEKVVNAPRSNTKNKPFNDNTATSENTMPEVKVAVEPASTAKH